MGPKRSPTGTAEGVMGTGNRQKEPTPGKDEYVQVDENPWELIRMGI